MKWIGIAVSALLGIVTGALLALWIAARRARAKIRAAAWVEYGSSVGDDEKRAVRAIIKKHKTVFSRAERKRTLCAIFGAREKAEKFFGVNYPGIIVEVATVFDPDGEDPALGISERQAFTFAHKALSDLVAAADAAGVPFLDKIYISSAIDVFSAVNAVAGNKYFRASSGALGIILRIINLFNPYFWIRTALTAIVTSLIVREVTFASIEIVAGEFADLYAPERIEEEEINEDQVQEVG